MNFDDRLRRELQHRANDLSIGGAGVAEVMAAAHARTRRSRLAGATIAAVLIIGVGGVALALRGTESPTLVQATSGDPETADVEAFEPNTAASTDAPETADEVTSDASVANTAPVGDAEAAPTSDATGTSSTPEPSTETGKSAIPGQDLPAAVDLVSHGTGFVALRTDNTLWLTSDASDWTQVTDPRPNSAARITRLSSHGGALYAAGDQPDGTITRPWVAVTTDLLSWQPVELPTPTGSGSDLTVTYTVVSALAAGPAGVIATGETFTDLLVEQLLPDDVLASGFWAHGNSLGDLSTLVIYDDGGETVQEIDLLAAGVPQSVIDRWADGAPTPFVGIGATTGPLANAAGALERGTVLASASVSESGFAGSGFSARFSSRVLWESVDGAEWTLEPISVVSHERAQTLGPVADRLVVLTGEGPIFTVQYRAGGEWNEVRLDLLFGSANDDYTLIDAAFDSSGVVVAATTVDEAQVSTLWLLSSADGSNWTAQAISGLIDSGSPVVGIDSVGVSADALAIGYALDTGKHGVIVIDR